MPAVKRGAAWKIRVTPVRVNHGKALAAAAVVVAAIRPHTLVGWVAEAEAQTDQFGRKLRHVLQRVGILVVLLVAEPVATPLTVDVVTPGMQPVGVPRRQHSIQAVIANPEMIN
jgi:hypothetical protein